MIRRWTFLTAAVFLFLLSLIRTSDASDAKSFFAYIKEIAEPAHAHGREDRQSQPLTLTFSLNGVSNYSYSVANIPTNFPIQCGGDDQNYCNYPDLPLVETYDLNYYSRRPIPSGRCPDGYTKTPTYDCLNIAPALFETTCCVFTSAGGAGSTVVATPCLTINGVAAANSIIDAMWTLCNGSIYMSSGASVWQYLPGPAQTLVLQPGYPALLSTVTGGAISRDLAEAEVDGQCNVNFFNMNDQYVNVIYTDGSLSNTGLQLDSALCLTGTPGLVYNLGRSTTIYKIDGDGFQAVIGQGFNFLIGNNITCNVAVLPPSNLGTAPIQNCSAATYVPNNDYLIFICNFGTAGNYFYFLTRNGTLLNATGGTAVGTVLANQCTTTAATGTGTGTSSSQVAPLVYIPYPIYPVFTGGSSGTVVVNAPTAG